MKEKLSIKLEENLLWFENNLGQSGDFYARKIKLCGIPCAMLLFDGIASSEKIWELFLEHLSFHRPVFSGQALMKYILHQSQLAIEPKSENGKAEIVQKLTSGFAVVLVDGCGEALLVPAQTMKHRSVDKPSSEGDIRGSQEAFTDLLRVNLGLLRRLIRSENLVMEVASSHTATQTEYAICYYRGRASREAVENIRNQMENLRLPVLFDSSYIAPFLQKSWKGILQPFGYTERPVTACAKICEGKIIVLVNGSPFVLIYPYFFAEHFECLDDYASTAYFAAINRLLKYLAFIVSIFLPGIYVMAIGFTPEIMPRILLKKILEGTEGTPLHALPEMILVLLVLEIIRIASLRMPKTAGSSVSLIAALVVGSTAVEAGLMSTPLVICAAISAISMYALPTLYEQITVLRLAFLLLCGILGPVGLALSIALLFTAIVGADDEGQAFLYPLWPLQKATISDGFVRLPWQHLKNNIFTVTEIENEASGQENIK